MNSRLTPDPSPVFDAVRDHLRRSRASAFVLHDEAGGFYVAVAESVADIVTMVTAGPEQMTPYLGDD